MTPDREIKEKKARRKAVTGLGDKPSGVQSASVSHQHVTEVEAMQIPESGHGERRARQGQVVLCKEEERRGQMGREEE